MVSIKVSCGKLSKDGKYGMLCYYEARAFFITPQQDVNLLGKNGIKILNALNSLSGDDF